MELVKLRRSALERTGLSPEQLELILNGISDGVIVTDSDGYLLFANQTAAEMWDFPSAAEMIRHPTDTILKNFELFTDEGEPFDLAQLPGRKVLSGELYAPEVVIKFRHKITNEVRWSIVGARAILNVEKNVAVAVVIFKDFTDRKRAEDSMKYLDDVNRVLGASLNYKENLSELAKLLVPRMADWVSIELLKPDEQSFEVVAVHHIDPAKRESAAEFRKKHVRDWNADMGVTHVVKTGVSEFYPEINESLLRQYTKDPELYNEILSVGMKSVIISPIKARDAVLGIFVMVSTDRKYALSDLYFAEEIGRRAGLAIDNARLYEEARTASKAKSLFLANMSHEIRTPLGAIIGFTDLLRSDELQEPERSDYIEIISRNSKLLYGLINDILDLSKIEAGYLETERLEVDLPQVVNDVVGSLSLRVREKGLQLKVSWDPHVPTKIQTDPVRLRQILINILGNAVKFTQKGEVRLFIQVPQPNEVLFVVEDTGPGISPEYRQRIFDWFTQGDASTTRKFGGTGLGLSLSRLLTQALGGNIVLDESYQAGSRFLITIRDLK